MYKIKSNYELKDIDSKGVMTAYVSIFNNVDSDGDMMMPGAFNKTISERGPGSSQPRIKHLWQHDTWTVIGIPQEMKADDTGLMVRSKFGSDQFSQDKLQQHMDGLITEFSIGYQVEKEDKSDDYNKLLELKLWEYSSVTWGANNLTHMVDAKGLDVNVQDELNKRMDKLVKALRNGKYTDETAEGFEIELKQIQAIYNELAKREPSKKDTHGEPVKSTLSATDIKELFKNIKL